MLRLRRFQKNEEGAIALVAAMAIVAAVGIGAFAIDYGHWQATITRMQNAADAAALAGAFRVFNVDHSDKITYVGNDKVRDIVKEVAHQNHIPLDEKLALNNVTNQDGEVTGTRIYIPDEDIKFGKWDSNTNQFYSTVPYPNASTSFDQIDTVEVTLKKTATYNGRVQNIMAQIFGQDKTAMPDAVGRAYLTITGQAEKIRQGRCFPLAVPQVLRDPEHPNDTSRFVDLASIDWEANPSYRLEVNLGTKSENEENCFWITDFATDPGDLSMGGGASKTGQYIDGYYGLPGDHNKPALTPEVSLNDWLTIKNGNFGQDPVWRKIEDTDVILPVINMDPPARQGSGNGQGGYYQYEKDKQFQIIGFVCYRITKVIPHGGSGHTFEGYFHYQKTIDAIGSTKAEPTVKGLAPVAFRLIK
jgi:hypothetical protein